MLTYFVENDDKLDVGENKTVTRYCNDTTWVTKESRTPYIHGQLLYQPITVCRYEAERFGSV